MSVQSSYFLFIEIQKIDQNRSVNPSFTMIKSFISRKLTKIQDFCPQKGCMCSPFRLPLGGASAFLCKHNCFGIQERGKYVTFLQYEYICTNLIVYLRDFRMSNKEHATTEYLPFASLKLPPRPTQPERMLTISYIFDFNLTECFGFNFYTYHTVWDCTFQKPINYQ